MTDAAKGGFYVVCDRCGFFYGDARIFPDEEKVRCEQCGSGSARPFPTLRKALEYQTQVKQRAKGPVIDDVVTRANYDAAVDLIRQWAVELAEEIETMQVLTPRCLELAVKIREANVIAYRLRRQMIVEVSG